MENIRWIRSIQPIPSFIPPLVISVLNRTHWNTLWEPDACVSAYYSSHLHWLFFWLFCDNGSALMNIDSQSTSTSRTFFRSSLFTPGLFASSSFALSLDDILRVYLRYTLCTYWRLFELVLFWLFSSVLPWHSIWVPLAPLLTTPGIFSWAIAWYYGDRLPVPPELR